MEPIKEGYLRVTEILSAFSGLNKIDPEVLKVAADRGTVVHRGIDCLVANIPLIELEDDIRKYCRNDEHYAKEIILVNNMLNSFKLWACGKKFLAKPVRLYDDEFHITGEFDLLYFHKDENNVGQLTLVDFKTPVSESKTWRLQGTGYDLLASANGITIDRIEFVKLDRKGNEPKSYFYDPEIELFLSVLETYRYFELDGIKDQQIDYL